MRIAMVGLRTIGEGSGGVEKAVEELSTRLAAKGHDVTVFCRKRYNTSGRSEFKGVQLRNLPAIYTKHLEAFSHTLLAMLHVWRGYDVVHFHATGPSLFSMLPRLTGRRTVVTVQGLDWRRAKWGRLARLALRLAEYTAVAFPHRTIVVSQFLESYYWKKYGREVTHIPNGITPGRQRAFDRLRRFDLDPGEYILFLSRLVPEKGCHTLIEAFRQVKTDFKLAIAGDAPHMQEYIGRLRSLAEGDSRVVFTGALYDEDKEEALSNAYLFVLPSDIEGLPIALLEAMSFGRCVLVSDIPENMEVVDPTSVSDLGRGEKGQERIVNEDGQDVSQFGVTFRCGDASHLALRIQELMDDKERVARIGSRARPYVVSHYSWDRIADETETLYRELLP